MRVMVIVKATKDSEAGMMPTAAMFEEMTRFNVELCNAGIMLSGDGQKPSSAASASRSTEPAGVLRTARSRDERTERGLLDLAGQGHGRGAGVGETLPQSDARCERYRNPPLSWRWKISAMP